MDFLATHVGHFFAAVYGSCSYGTGEFDAATSSCSGLAKTGFPTDIIVGLAAGLVLIALAVMLHRSSKRKHTSTSVNY